MRRHRGTEFGFNPPRPCIPLKEANPKPFLSLQTTCSSTPETTVNADSWPTGDARTVFTDQKTYRFPSALTGCELLDFAPTMSLESDTHAASTPTGITVKVSVPQDGTLSASGLAEADIQSTTLTLPEGVQANPGAANGLLTCSAGEVGFNGFEEGLPEGSQLENDHFNTSEAECPDAAKIGNVRIHTPLLAHDLTGGAYLASQDTNPFATPLVLYLVAKDPVSGVLVKLAGEVQIDQATGQLTSVFKNTPPVPFETLEVHLFGESRASQSTPPLCGEPEGRATFVPWNGAAPVTAGASSTSPKGPKAGPARRACRRASRRRSKPARATSRRARSPASDSRSATATPTSRSPRFRCGCRKVSRR